MVSNQTMKIFAGCLLAASWQADALADNHCNYTTSPTQVGGALPSASTNSSAVKRVENYWTLERMQNAKPTSMGHSTSVQKKKRKWKWNWNWKPTKRPPNGSVELKNNTTHTTSPTEARSYPQDCN